MDGKLYAAYCAVIPIGGAEDAISRADLARAWGISDRMARERIAGLREYDNGDRYIIVSSSHKGGGYYRTTDEQEIRRYIAETRARAANTFRPLKKAQRVLANWYSDGTPRQLAVDIPTTETRA